MFKTINFFREMKKLFSALVGILLIGGVAFAQDPVDGAKLAKQAGKALTSYNMDPVGNKGKLDEAIEKISAALKTPEAQASASAWITKGDIYAKRLGNDQGMQAINPKHEFTGDNDALEAFEAYAKALSIPEIKKFEKSDAVKGISVVQSGMLQIGGNKFGMEKYDKAYASYAGVIAAHDILKGAKTPSALDDASLYNEVNYYAGVLASEAKMYKEAIPYLEKVAALDSVKAYTPLYNAKLGMGDKAGAEKILTEGRKKFPNDSGLLFAEINAYLTEGRLSELTDRLKEAIAKEPTNVGLYTTTGNVYDNLAQAMTKEKKDAEAMKYQDEAAAMYNKALQMDPSNAFATYGLGQIYYNRAAAKIAELIAVSSDNTKEGQKKYDILKKESNDLFDQALPYFQKAEALDPNDTNTLVALKEIYARKEDDLSLEFKKRLEVVNGGGKNTSYFKK